MQDKSCPYDLFSNVYLIPSGKAAFVIKMNDIMCTII